MDGVQQHVSCDAILFCGNLRDMKFNIKTVQWFMGKINWTNFLTDTKIKWCTYINVYIYPLAAYYNNQFCVVFQDHFQGKSIRFFFFSQSFIIYKFNIKNQYTLLTYYLCPINMNINSIENHIETIIDFIIYEGNCRITFSLYKV